MFDCEFRARDVAYRYDQSSMHVSADGKSVVHSVCGTVVVVIDPTKATTGSTGADCESSLSQSFARFCLGLV
jgi:hypothetical protein